MTLNQSACTGTSAPPCGCLRYSMLPVCQTHRFEQAHAQRNGLITAGCTSQQNRQYLVVQHRSALNPRCTTRVQILPKKPAVVVVVSHAVRCTGFFAASVAQDEIFRADKQPSAKSRNFSSFHTEQGGPIVHMTRPPTADAMNLRHSHADAGHNTHTPCHVPQSDPPSHSIAQWCVLLLPSQNTASQTRRLRGRMAGARWCAGRQRCALSEFMYCVTQSAGPRHFI
jgi:hypothetical protein